MPFVPTSPSTCPGRGVGSLRAQLGVGVVGYFDGLNCLLLCSCALTLLAAPAAFFQLEAAVRQVRVQAPGRWASQLGAASAFTLMSLADNHSTFARARAPPLAFVDAKSTFSAFHVASRMARPAVGD